MSSIFQTMRDQSSVAAAQKTFVPPEHVAITLEEAIQKMDRLFAVVIASQIRKDRGMPSLGFNRDDSMLILEEAKRGARMIHSLERGGNALPRIFSVEHWKPLIDCTTLDDAQNFANSAFMNPSVCVRIILSMTIEEIL